MNKIFKVIYNRAKHCYIVASELAKSYSKGGGSRSIRRACVALGIAVSIYAAAGSALANSGGDEVVSGSQTDYVGHSPYNVEIDTNVSGDVYGHKDSYQNVSNASVTMTGGEIAYYDPTENTANLFGGYSETGDVSSNSVNISNGTVIGSVYSGFSLDGNAASNSVNIIGDTTEIKGTAFGGHVTRGTGDANSNKVIIGSGTIGSIVGGYSLGGNTASNSINISGGIIEYSVYGGLSDLGNAASNSVTLSGGIVQRDVYGGISSECNAASNSVIISGGRVNDSVYGGYSYFGNAASNSVNISGDSTQIGSVYGGYVDSGTGSAYENKVNISDGTINGFVSGGYAAGSGDAKENQVTMTGGEILYDDSIEDSGDLYGGYSNKGNAASNSVNISGGTVKAVVHGGFTKYGNAASNSVNISGDSTQIGSVYGGYVASGTGSAYENKVNISGGTINGYVRGGYASGAGDANENQVTMTGGKILYNYSTKYSGNLYGGYSESGNSANNSVNISDDSTKIDDKVYGGYVASGTGSAYENKVNISGGTIDRDVYGGFSQYGKVASNSVNISGGSINDVFGGYSFYGNATSNSVNISDGSIGNVYGGLAFSISSSAMDNQVNISGGSISRVYGGCSVFDNVASNTVNINGGSIYDEVIGGYSSSGNAASNSVNISGGTVNKNVYGGYSDSGNVVSNSVYISGDTTQIEGNIYGGVASGTGYANYNQVNISSGTLKIVYGGFSEAGNTASNSINISGNDIKIRKVYGGYVESGKGSANENKVNISGGSINAVIGGSSDSGNAASNSVTISGGNVNYVYGGDSYSGNAACNSVNISGDSTQIDSDVYGGYTTVTGSANNNKVNISGNTNIKGTVYGGFGKENSVSNIINVSGGTFNSEIIGGFSECYATANVVNISGDTNSEASVFGGLSAGVADHNIVNISDGTIKRYVYGGATTVGDSESNVVNISNGYSYSVCGGSTDDGNAVNNHINISGGNFELLIGGMSSYGSSLNNSVNIKGGNFSSDSMIVGGYIFEPGNSTISNNSVNLGNTITGLDKSEVYGYFYESGSGTHSGNELHIGRTLDYDDEGNIQRDSEGKIKYKSDSSTIWQGKSSNGTVNNSINKIADFDTIALHSVAWNNDLPAVKAAVLESIGTVDITDLKFYENGSEKSTFELNDKMNLLAWENEDDGPINLTYKVNGAGEEQTGAFADNQKGFVVQTKAVSETSNGIELNGTETGKVKKVDKAVQFAVSGITLNSVDLTNWDGINTSEVPDYWTANDNGVSVAGKFTEPALASGESINILTVSTDMFKDENIDESIRYSEIQFNNDFGNGVTLSGLQTGGVKVSNGGKYLSYYAIKKTADNLTFGNVEWLDKGALIDHKTMLSDVSFDGAAVDTSKIAFTNKQKLDADMKMTLVSDFNGTPCTITGSKYKVGTAYEGEGSAYIDGNDLVFKTKTGAGLSDETHTTVMAMEAGVAMLAAGSEHVGNAIEGLGFAANTGSDGVSTFASVGGASSRYETGSHIDTNSWNCTLAVGKNLEKKDGTFEYGLFAEYSRGNYTLHMNGNEDAGSGNIHYTGGGLLLKWTNKHDVYTEASVRIGNMKDKASNLLHDGTGNAYGYDTNSKYRGGHIGFGKICREEDGTKLDIYGKYFYNQREGINFAAGTDQYKLDDVRSRVLRAGFRLSSTDKKWNRYGGISYDYEFGGQSNGTVNGNQIRAASIKGGTVRGEFGYCREATKTNPWKTDISLYGFTGQRRGFGGSVAFEYHF